MARFGFQPGHGWSRADGEAEWRRFWASLGDLDWQSGDEARAEAIRRWRAWLAKI